MIYVRTHTFQLLLLLMIVFGCDSTDTASEYRVLDYTRYRDFDSTLSKYGDSLSLGEIQNDYDDKNLRRFQEVLNELNIESLKNIAKDTTAYRLVINFGWGSTWSGSPLSLTISEGSKFSHIETVEILHFDRADVTRQQLNYDVATTNFDTLIKSIERYEHWTDFSFEENNGWSNFDNNEYYLELRQDSIYKLLVREIDDMWIWEKMEMPFLIATEYNDTIVELVQKSIERTAKMESQDSAR